MRVRLDDENAKALAEALDGERLDAETKSHVMSGNSYVCGSLYRVAKDVDVVNHMSIDIYVFGGEYFAFTSEYYNMYALPDELGRTLEKLLTDNWENEFFNGYEMIIER